MSLFDQLEMKNPYPFYEWARKNSPLFFASSAGLWVVTKYVDVREILADEVKFSAEADRDSYAGLSPEARAVLAPLDFEKLYGLSTTENPDHDRVKRAVLPAFNDLYLARLKPQLERLADEYVNGIAHCAETDLVATVCNPYPTAAIFEVLGVPRSDVAQVKEWSKSRLKLTWGTPDEQVYHAHNVVRYWQYCRELVDRKIAAPGDDLPSTLGVMIRNGRLTQHDIEKFIYGLFFSGHATTSAFLAESIRLLLVTDTWQMLAATQVPVGQTADELLRLCPSAFTRRRLALEEVTIRGQQIPKGATILLVIGSANRDEEVFEEPNCLRLDRINANKHLSFGHGFHYCIGAKIVKLEYSTLLDKMIRRFPKLHLIPGCEPTYNRNLSIRMPNSLHVSLGNNVP